MGCKPIYNQDETEDEYVFEGLDESHSRPSEFTLGFVVEKESFDSSSDVGYLPEKLIGDDSVATNYSGTEPTVRGVTSDNIEEKSTDDDDAMTKRKQLLRFRRSDKTRVTVRRSSMLPPSTLNVCTEVIDLKKEVSTEQNKLPPSSKIGIGGSSTSTNGIGSEQEKPISKDTESSSANINVNASTTDVLLPVPDDTAQPTTENRRTLLNDHDDLNAPDQVHSHTITTESSQPSDEESSIDEDREKRRLQWLARRKATIPSVHVQPELPSDTHPREIDIDSVIARKKFPWIWMR